MKTETIFSSIKFDEETNQYLLQRKPRYQCTSFSFVEQSVFGFPSNNTTTVYSGPSKFLNTAKFWLCFKKENFGNFITICNNILMWNGVFCSCCFEDKVSIRLVIEKELRTAISTWYHGLKTRVQKNKLIHHTINKY
jgi:hypothetical protein